MDGSLNVGVFEESGSRKHWNMVAGGVAGRIEDDNSRLFYLTDHLGSTRAVMDDAGLVQESHDYYPFGLQMPGRSLNAGTKELFTGKERDTETGWDYFGARFYDASIGRWLSVDPLADDFPSLSAYIYTYNNPLGFVDPDGRSGIKLNVKSFPGYLAARNKLINFLRNSPSPGPGRSLGKNILATAIDFFTPGSVEESFSSGVMGLAGISVKGPGNFRFSLTKSANKVDGRSKLLRDARKVIKESVTEAKDLKGSIAEAEIAADVLAKSSGSGTATGLADFAEGVLKQGKVSAVLEKIGKPIRKLIEKVQDKIDDFSVKE